MGCCCSSEDVKKNLLINKIFIEDDLGKYDRSELEEVGTCSICKTDGLSVICKWLDRDFIYICEYCELEMNNRDIVKRLKEIM